MAKVAVVYFSGSGTTAQLAQSVAQGISDAGATAALVAIEGNDITQGRWSNEAIAADLDACEAIVFGSPTYMGSVSGALKCFMDAMAPRWYTKAWNNKLGAGFTVSSLSAGDKQNCLFSMVTFAMQMGMRWIGTGAGPGDGLNQNGFYLGVGATASSPEQLSDADKATARHLGERVVAAL